MPQASPLKDNEYDDKHQVIRASNDGVSMYAGYDSRGNTTGTMLTGTGTDLRIASAAGYDSTGNRVTSQTDARGKTTSYGYSSAMSRLTNQPTTVTDANNVTRTNVYRSLNSRIKSTSIANTVSLEYTYDSGRLATMTRKGYVPNVSGQKSQTYTMSYDSFGNMTGVSVGDKTLASYSYGSNNGPLQQMSYGNGASVSYAYDQLERVSKVYYNGSTNPALEYSCHRACRSKKCASWFYHFMGVLSHLLVNVHFRILFYFAQ